ncbi:hypothetical protein [Micromonospora sp. DT47]|uniref:hypothetical protein n=1 Tax=Micromonospora sp. DT47 TaxID=3393431 RepID=UPI003CEE7605
MLELQVSGHQRRVGDVMVAPGPADAVVLDVDPVGVEDPQERAAGIRRLPLVECALQVPDVLADDASRLALEEEDEVGQFLGRQGVDVVIDLVG